MKLFYEILVKAIEEEKMEVIFPNIKTDPHIIVEMECYEILKQIQNIIKDDTLNDEECFMKIEKIICLFEDININTGIRHDF